MFSTRWTKKVSSPTLIFWAIYWYIAHFCIRIRKKSAIKGIFSPFFFSASACCLTKNVCRWRTLRVQKTRSESQPRVRIQEEKLPDEQLTSTSSGLNSWWATGDASDDEMDLMKLSQAISEASCVVHCTKKQNEPILSEVAPKMKPRCNDSSIRGRFQISLFFYRIFLCAPPMDHSSRLLILPKCQRVRCWEDHF